MVDRCPELIHTGLLDSSVCAPKHMGRILDVCPGTLKEGLRGLGRACGDILRLSLRSRSEQEQWP